MRWTFRNAILVGMVVSLLSGCATTDSTRTKAEGAALGATVLGGIGALAGALICGRDCAAIGAGAGALVGAGAGYLVGSSVADRKEKYASEEDRLEGEIKVVEQYNSELNEYNEKTASRIEKLDQEIADLKSRKSASRSKTAELKSKKEQLNALISDTNKRSSGMNKELVALEAYQQSIQQANDQVKVAKLNKEIDVLKNNIAMLDTSNKQLAQLVSKTTVVRK